MELGNYKGSRHVPEGIEATIGWRVWNPEYDDGRLVQLKSISWQGPEPQVPGRVIEAVCDRNRGKFSFDALPRPTAHEAPGDKCQCGIYAKTSLRRLIHSGYTDMASLLAEVALWGTVLDHDHGYRAQYAYPHRFYVFEPEPRYRDEPGWHRLRRARMVGDAWDVPCEIVGDISELLDRQPAHCEEPSADPYLDTLVNQMNQLVGQANGQPYYYFDHGWTVSDYKGASTTPQFRQEYPASIEQAVDEQRRGLLARLSRNR